MISALEIHGVPIECINQAAVTYHVPATLILSVLAVENGKTGSASLIEMGLLIMAPCKLIQSGYRKSNCMVTPNSNCNMIPVSTSMSGLGYLVNIL